MYNFLILELWNKDRFDNVDYSVVLTNKFFDNYSDACLDCDQIIDQYIQKYIGTNTDYDEEDYYKSLYVDNTKIYRNVLLEFSDRSIQCIVSKMD